MIDLSTAYKLWVDGRLLLSNGVVGKSREEMTPQYLSQTASFQPRNNTIEIILQVSNYYHRKGGVWKYIEFGEKNRIRNKRERQLAFDLFLLGSLLIIGLYHFGLYAIRTKDRSSLYFGIASITASLRTIVTGERSLTWLFPDFNWELFLKLEYLTIYVSIPAFFLFMGAILQEVSRRVSKASIVIAVIFALATVTTSIKVSSYIIFYFQIFSPLHRPLYHLRDYSRHS